MSLCVCRSSACVVTDLILAESGLRGKRGQGGGRPMLRLLGWQLLVSAALAVLATHGRSTAMHFADALRGVTLWLIPPASGCCSRRPSSWTRGGGATCCAA